MRHAITFVIDQTDDDPGDQIADADELRDYIAEAVGFMAGRGKRPRIETGGLVFWIDPARIEVEEAP